ncbi:hypothetical protein Droror1_Dr00024814, partial [Drosera rotundifolia]
MRVSSTGFVSTPTFHSETANGVEIRNRHLSMNRNTLFQDHGTSNVHVMAALK